jgi:hypothetical protein
VLAPNTSNLSSPIYFRRDRDFYIAATIKLDCDKPLEISIQWTINKCPTPACLTSAAVNDGRLITSFNDLYIPVLVLFAGLYDLKLKVTKSVHVCILPSDSLINLLPLQTSMIAIGFEQSLSSHPGLHSFDLDEDPFNASVISSLSTRTFFQR